MVTRAHSQSLIRASSRPWSLTRTAMVMRTPSRPWRARLRRDQRVRFTQIKRQPTRSNVLKLRHISADLRIQPVYSNPLGGMGTASPRDAAPTSQWAPRSSRHLRPRAWIPEESGQVGLDKSPQVRRQGNRIRRTNDGSRRPDPASRWRLGSQSPLLYFITYFLKCLADFLQVVVRLFQ